jgi:hypothetical protein
MYKILSISLMALTMCYAAEDVVNNANIDQVSRSLVKDYFKSDDKIYDRMKLLWYNESKATESINQLRGQDLQYKSKAVEHYAITADDNVILIGSKSITNAVKIVYLIETKNDFVPITISWNVKNDSYRLSGISWGAAQCQQDVSDLTVKNPGIIKGPLEK